MCGLLPIEMDFIDSGASNRHIHGQLRRLRWTFENGTLPLMKTEVSIRSLCVVFCQLKWTMYHTTLQTLERHGCSQISDELQTCHGNAV